MAHKPNYILFAAYNGNGYDPKFLCILLSIHHPVLLLTIKTDRIRLIETDSVQSS